MTVFKSIRELGQFSTLSKHEQLVDGVINAINEGALKKGDQLPSINQMANEIGFARKTIVKAYEDLKSRGIVESKNFVGYFIASVDTDQKLKVALLLYAFHTFQEAFYNTFRSQMEGNVQIDIFFHHNNQEIFNTIIGNIANKYGRYVIAPIHSETSKQTLQQIPQDKLIVVDRYLRLSDKASYVVQEFENSTFDILEELKDSITPYNKFVIFFKENSDYPIEIKKAYDRFVEKHGILPEVQGLYEPGSVEKGCAYLVINDAELWDLLKDCKEKGLLPGRDIGILSHNESSVKDLIQGGITTFSTNFNEMAYEAAKCLNDKIASVKVIPTVLYRRTSL